MARFHAGTKSASAGSSTLPVGGLAGHASVRGIITEIGVTNTTTTGVELKIVRLTAAGTPGSTITADKDDPAMPANNLLAKDTWTIAPTIVDTGYGASLGAAVGAGFVWTFEDGLYVPAGAGNGYAIIPVGTGQVLRWYIVWEE